MSDSGAKSENCKTIVCTDKPIGFGALRLVRRVAAGASAVRFARWSVNHTQLGRPSAVLNFSQQSGSNVVYKSTISYLPWYPRMGTQLLQLMPHIFVNILKRVEKRG